MSALSPAPERHRHWRAAGSLICGGSGAGLMLFAALRGAAGWPVAPLVAMGLAALGLMLVWLEIGRPLRIRDLFIGPRRSWMAREAYAVSAFFVLGLAGTISAAWWLIALAALSGLVFLYAQARILTAARGIPAWHQPRLVAVVLATGITEGGGLMLAHSGLEAETPGWLLALFLVLVLLRAGAFAAYRRRLAAAGAPRDSLDVIASSDRELLFAGLFLPALAALLALAAPTVSGMLLLFAGLAAAAAGWQLKYELVVRAGHVQDIVIEGAHGRGPGGTGARPGRE